MRLALEPLQCLHWYTVRKRAGRGAAAIQAAERESDRCSLRGASRRSRMRHMQTVKGLAMEKWLCWGSMGVAGVLLVLFLLDLVLSIANVPYMPFGGLDKVVDVIGIIASGLLFYLAWDAYKDVR